MTKQSEDSNDIFFDLNDLGSVLKKRWKQLLIIYFVFLGATFTYIFFKKPIYETNFTVTIISKFSASGKEIIENFNLLYGYEGVYKKNNKINDLSKDLLNLDKIEVLNTDAAAQSEITTLKVKMCVYDTASIDSILQVLMAYCNNNKSLIEKMNNEKEKLVQTKDHYQNQLNALILNKQKTEKESTLSEMHFDIYLDIGDLQEKIATLENELRSLKGIEIAAEPIIPIKPVGLSLAMSIVVATTLGLVLCAFFVLFLDKFSVFLKKP